MAKSGSALRAGLLMLVSVGLIVAVIIGVKGLSWITDPQETRLVSFDLKTNVGGLRVGDEVRIGGAKVGDVKKIAVNLDTPGKPPHILVSFTMPKKYPIKEGAKLRVDGTLTGTSWLNFESMGDGATLDSSQPLVGLGSSMTELLASVSDLAPQVKQTIADVREKTLPKVNDTVDKFGKTAESFKQTGDSATGLANDIRGSYKPIIDKYHAVADKAIAMMESIRAVFGDTHGDFRDTMANIAKTTGSLKEKLPGLIDKVNGAMTKVDTALDGVNKTLGEVHTTVVNAKDLSVDAKAVIVGNKSKLDGIIDSVKKAGDNLKAATAEIRRSPWRLLYKPAPNEMANLNLYDSARQFAEGANDLNDAAAALRDTIKGGKASEEEVKKLMQKVEEKFARFKEVEGKLWANVKE